MSGDSFRKKLNKLHEEGKVNLFCMDHYGDIDHLTDEEEDIFIIDLMLLSDLGVEDEESATLAYYIDHFIDDLSEEIFGIDLSPDVRRAVVQYMYDKKSELDYNDLASFRIAILKWVSDQAEKEAVAYPNKVTQYKKRPRDMNEWYAAVNKINDMRARKITEKDALSFVSAKMPVSDKYDFLTWYSFNYGKNKDLYNIQKGAKSMDKKAFISEETPDSYYLFNRRRLEERDKRNEAPQTMHVEDHVTKEESMEARKKMLGRTYSLDRMIEKYKHIMSNEEYNAIANSIHELRSKIRGLKSNAMVENVMYKTASIFRANNFEDGADMMESIAKLSFDGPIVKEAAPPNIPAIMQRLQAVGNIIARKDLIRELAALDVEMHNSDYAGFFNELLDAQAKLIDAFNYANNKVESISGKLRGGIGRVNNNPATQPVQQEQQQQAPAKEKAKAPGKIPSTLDEALHSEV